MHGIYVHIPFCKQACYYCDFHFSTQLKNESALVSALCSEIELRRTYLNNESLDSIYLGGGTPSILSYENLEKIFDQIRSQFRLKENIEITLEANPDDITQAKLDQWKKLGINRLSIGIQSFRDQDLEFMNRAHNASESVDSVIMAKEHGFHNISIDLIYGIPGLKNTEWIQNIERAIELDVQHISAYCLTIEPNTVFGKWNKKGKLNPLDDEEIALQFKTMRGKLNDAGFDHYEVSNFALTGFISKHNSNYWSGASYIGVGPSAHSFDSNSRSWNISNNHRYIKAIEGGLPYFEEEKISNETAYNEYVLTRLRTKWGIDLNYVKDQFNVNIEADFKKELGKHSKHLSLKDNFLKLNESGLLFADLIASDLFLT